MRAAHFVAIAFGIDGGQPGLEHGHFETLQGSATPSGVLGRPRRRSADGRTTARSLGYLAERETSLGSVGSATSASSG